MPSRELAVLQTCLMEAYDRIDKAAYELGLTFGRDPILAMSTHQPETHSSLIFRQELVDYRRRLFTRRHELIDLRLANYAAGIAATQVHVGGVGFAHYDRVVPLLYNAEPRVLSWAASRVQSRYPGAEVNQIRDNLYRSVFKGYPLVCYPDFEWSTTRWLDALMRTPLFGTPTDYFAAGTVEEYPELDALDVSDFLYRVRDLQWIKPHRQGTLEFRSVPALPSVADIVELCQIRLTMVHDLIHG